MTTPNIGMPELTAGQAGKELTHNQALAILDQLVQAVVVDKDLATPPGSPADGALYIVATGATGAWSGKSGKLAFWLDSVAAWTFLTPANGWSVWVNDESKRYELIAGSWVAASSMANPMTTAGDIVVGVASGAPSRLGLGSNGQVLTITGGNIAWGTFSGIQCIPIACSDEVTAITSGTAKVTFRMPYGFTLSGVRASLTTAQTSGSILTIDINEGGTSLLSTKLTIDNTEKTSTTAAAPAVISDSSLADDAEVTIDIDQIGDGTAKGLKVYLIGVPV